MDTSRIGLFDLAEKRLTWAASRQNTLASNIANANTPGFKAHDVQSFEKMLSGYGSLQPARTENRHMSGTGGTDPVSLTTDRPTTRSIDGNTVTLDEQMTKVAATDETQSMVTTIWKKYVGLFSLALGR